MNELLEVAKAVIYGWDSPKRDDYLGLGEVIARLRAAVERAEKQEIVGFREWADETKPTILARAFCEMAWSAAQQAERERIKKIITYQFSELVSDLSEVMEMIDE